MLQWRRSRPKQSKPSTLMAAGLCPNFILTHPPLSPPPPPDLRTDEDMDGDDGHIGDGGAGDKGIRCSLQKRASWITGLDTLHGGDPKKYGGEDATGAPNLSPPYPPYTYPREQLR